MKKKTVLESTTPKTDKEILEAEAIAIKNNPFYLVESGLLSIKTKNAELVKLHLNNTQKAVFEVINKYRKKNKPLRAWILKARQEGVSTLVEALIYALTSQQDNTNSLIMADEKEHANNLFDMSKLYHEQLEKNEPHLTPNLKKSNEKKLEFEKTHSQIIIATADNTDAARSHTYHNVHLSEVAFFRDLATVMTGLNQSVPDNKNTFIIGETTANGQEAFYDEWIRAIEGKTDWLPIFIPWFFMEEYSRELQDGQLYPIEGVKFNKDYTQQWFLKEEQRLRDEEELTEAQLNWRRWKIVNACNGRMTDFMQEYPSNWKEAFVMSGSNFFDNEGMKRQKERIPKDIGEIFESDLKYEFRALPEGRIKLYEYPAKGEQYVVSLDASEALGLDEGSALVLNKRTNSTCAVANGQYAPEALAHIGLMLGNYFNKAEIAPENKGYGYMVCQLINSKYGNIFKRIITKDGEQEEKEELGFNTNGITRPEYLGRMAEEIELSSTYLYDKDLINQCNTFIINPKTKKAEAALNKQDGLVICRAIAGQVRHLHPYKVRSASAKAKKKRRLNELRDNVNMGFGFDE